MSENKRKSLRIPLTARVRVIHSSFGQITLKARDISDGGMFIFSDDDNSWPAVGSVMQVQALDTPVEAAILNVRIVHVHSNGVGVMFFEC